MFTLLQGFEEVSKNTRVPVMVTARFTDGTTIDVTNDVRTKYSSSNVSRFTLRGSVAEGARGGDAGIAEVVVTYRGVRATKKLDVVTFSSLVVHATPFPTYVAHHAYTLSLDSVDVHLNDVSELC